MVQVLKESENYRHFDIPNSPRNPINASFRNQGEMDFTFLREFFKIHKIRPNDLTLKRLNKKKSEPEPN
ncbi:hypothetical protein BpHYR1_042592 [Brachionus plicatilis]|uniref:Uncharacterized protein n=1 Tax=Brachionus plicatilis TaxID=10195 RepID=A0A3M7QKE6_BRAPC|nr:hypothetical protein BpHYR1_042592 [Brachionus plicatilis]